MKSIIILNLALICFNISYGQTEDEILAEAYLLYNLEKASWNGTDIFLEQFPEKRNLIGGYFSYSENDYHNCIFFNQDETPKILAKITFDQSFDVAKTVVDTTKRKLDSYEMDLFQIRKNALKEINADNELFKQYNNTNLNPIPIISGEDRKVFVLTGPTISGVVVLGNDYLLTFDEENNLKEKKSLHKNIIPIDYDNKTKDVVTMHSHIETTGDLITSTDLCTIMLYEKYANWKQHIVISKNNVSLWDCKKDKLVVMTRKAWERISEHQNNKN
ncbi:hypothetical protein [uncultured Aquimarina sp.]|uniref:hypothetical protein n=1 Tax=uncultured Aquimarina sp. TaxID=575652 RepID=UPI002616501A|nr:hypothetical protein [uncultured Aquimarina sp.]